MTVPARLKALLPAGWFRDSPVLDAVLTGIGAALQGVHDLTEYARKQTRITTAADGFLDLIALDFFGTALLRRVSEVDAPYRQRILAQLFLERGTRKGMIRALEILTGRTPLVFEPARPADTGGYGTGVTGYGVAGRYGSLALPSQAFVTAYRPSGSGIPLVAGYGTPPGGYSTGSRATYSTLDQIIGAVTDADIFQTVNRAAPAGTRTWVTIQT